jgi:hypothetical protein
MLTGGECEKIRHYTGMDRVHELPMEARFVMIEVTGYEWECVRVMTAENFGCILFSRKED